MVESYGITRVEQMVVNGVFKVGANLHLQAQKSNNGNCQHFSLGRAALTPVSTALSLT